MTHAEARIEVATPVRHGTTVRRDGTLLMPDGTTAPLWFEHTALDDDPSPPVLVRPFLLAALVPAMRGATALCLPSAVDATTLANLMEWQEAMASWRPALRPVAIRCDALADAAPAPIDQAVTCFSGGVDSCFTVSRHARGGAHRTTHVGAGLMVHGFDIGLDRGGDFAGAWERARAILGHFGLRALRLRTNLRTLEPLTGCDWEYETHGIWLAAAIACVETGFSRMLLPSTYPYPWLRLPWASNPITDPLLGSGAVPCWHDGAAWSKLDKVREIARHDVMRANVRVCWQGPRLDRNCGRCFKCLATQACFRLAGAPIVAAFPEPCRLDEVARMPITTAPNALLVASMRDAARAQGDDPLARALATALDRRP